MGLRSIKNMHAALARGATFIVIFMSVVLGKFISLARPDNESQY